MTPDNDDTRDDWLTVEEKLSVHREPEQWQRDAAELAIIRRLVDEANTECQLGSQIAAHFGRTLPDTEDT